MGILYESDAGYWVAMGSKFRVGIFRRIIPQTAVSSVTGLWLAITRVATALAVFIVS